MSCQVDLTRLDSKDELIRKAAERFNKMGEARQRELVASTGRAVGSIATARGITVEGKQVIRVENGVVKYIELDGSVGTASVSDLVSADGDKVGPEEVTTLGSDIDFVKQSMNDFEEVGTDIMNDPVKMVELGKEIDDADMRKSSPWHRSQLVNSLMEVVDPIKNALPSITVMLNKQMSMTGGKIDISADTAKVWVGIGPGSGNRSALEAYVHELYHAATDYILSQNDVEISRYTDKVKKIMVNFIENTTAADLSKFMSDKTTADKDAEDMLEYIAEYGMEEFIPYARSNEAVMRRLEELHTEQVKKDSKSKGPTYEILLWIRKAFNKIMSRVRKEPQGNDYETMAWLVNKIVAANNKQLHNKKNAAIDRIGKAFDRYDIKVKNYVDGLKSKVGDSFTDIPGGPKGWLAIAKVMAKATMSDVSKVQVETILSTWAQKPEGSVQTWLRDMSKSDEYQDNIDNLIIASQDVDRRSQLEGRTALNMIRDAFGRDLSSSELDALGVMVRTDSVVLAENLDSYLENESNIGQRALEIEKELHAEFGTEISNYYKGQAMTLARFMLTGNGDITLLTNARSIAMRSNDVSVNPNVTEELVAKIDEITSLYALMMSSKKDRDGLKTLLDSSSEGSAVMYMQLKAIQEESKELFKDGQWRFQIKGYQSEVYPIDSESKVAPIKDKEAMRREGFKLVKEVKHHSLHDRAEPMGFYVSTMPIRTRLHTASFRYTGQQHRGYSIRDSYRAEDTDYGREKADTDINKLKLQMMKVLRERKKGNFEVDFEDRKVRPVVNAYGEIVDFTYEMTREDKIKYLGIDTNPLEEIAATKRTIVDKLETPMHNAKVVESIKQDMKEHALKFAGYGDNFKEYVWVGPDSTLKGVKDLWQLLPKEVRTAFTESKEGKAGFYVRRDMLNNYMGYKELMLTRTALGKRLPAEWKYYMDVAEMIWKNVVSLAKSNIVIKMPFVLVDNIISNVALSVLTGSNPIQVLRLQLQGVKALHDHMEEVKKVIALETKVAAGIATSKDLKMLKVRKANLEKSAVKELVDGGFYTQILEELDQRNDRDTGNIISDTYHRKMKGLPKVIRNGVSFALLDNRTGYFKFMSNATQYSDFVARFAQFQLYKRRGMNPKKALNKVKDEFINYSRPNSKLVEWANQVGLIMFSKYYIRIQRFLHAALSDTPVRTAAGVAGLATLDAATGLVIADPYDSSLLNKSPLGMIKDAWDVFVTAMTPGLATAYANVSGR